MKKLRSFFKRITSGRTHEETGQAIVETALAVPILVLLLCGILDFGWIYSNQYKIQYAAFQGARCAAMYAANDDVNGAVRKGTAKAEENLPAHTRGASVQVTVGHEKVKVSVTCPIRTLTFVGSTIFGKNYTAKAESIAAY